MCGVSSSPYFSLTDLVKRWPPTTARRAVIMATDGIDRFHGTGDLQNPYLDEAIYNALRAGITVSAIYTPSVGHYGRSYWQTYWGQISKMKNGGSDGTRTRGLLRDRQAFQFG